jgi:TP901 family phage tail tape measure protein
MADKSFLDIIIRAKDTASEAIKKVNTSLGNIPETANAVNRSTKSLSATFSTLRSHWIAISAGVASIGLPLAQSIKQFKNFETALVDMGKVTDQSLDTIKQAILSLDPAIGNSTELMKGYYQVISAGVSEPVKALELLTIASQSAKASHTDQSEVIKGLTKLMAGYEGEITNVTEASDLLFAIEKEGQTSFRELIPVIGSLAKLSKDLGVSSDEMGASLAQITQVVGSTAEASTQYIAILTALTQQEKVSTIVTKELGFAGIQQAIATHGLNGILKILRERVGGSAEAMKQLLGRIEAVKGQSALSANNFQNVGDKIEVMTQKTGRSRVAFEKYKVTLEGLWDTFKNTLSKIAIEIGAEIAPELKDLVQTFSDKAPSAVKKFSALIKVLTGVFKLLFKAIGFVIENIDAFAYALGVYSITHAPHLIGQIATAFNLLTASIVRANTAMKGFLPVLVAIVSYKVGKWLKDLELGGGGTTIQERFEIIILSLQQLVQWFGILIKTVRKYANEILTLGIWDSAPIDKQIESIKKQIDILEGAKDIVKEEAKARDEVAKAIKKTTEATKESTKEKEKEKEVIKKSVLEEVKGLAKREQAYNSFLVNLKTGSAKYIAIRKKELAVTKANLDFELAEAQQAYQRGLISQTDYLNKKIENQKKFNAEVIKLKEEELAHLEQLPDVSDEHFQKIYELENEIVALKKKSLSDQLKLQIEHGKAIETELKKDFEFFASIKERELDAIKHRNDLADLVEQQAVAQSLLRHSDHLDYKLDRSIEYYEKELELAKETEEKMIEIHGLESKEFEDAKTERIRIQQEMEIAVIESEENIKEAIINEVSEAQKFVAEIIGDRQKLVELQAEEELNQLENLLDLKLITYSEYADAVEAIEKGLTTTIEAELDRRKDDNEKFIIATRATMDETSKLISEALDKNLGDIYDSIQRLGNWYNLLKFPELDEAIQKVLKEIRTLVGKVPDEILKLTNNLGQGVSAQLFQFAQEASKYLIKVRGMIDALNEQIMSYREQILQLSGDEVALVHLWYERELAKLKEEFAGLEGTAEYREALKLIEQLYKQKLDKARESMEKESDLAEEETNKRVSSAGALADSMESIIIDPFKKLKEQGSDPELFAPLKANLLSAMEPLEKFFGRELTLKTDLKKELKVDLSSEVKAYDRETTIRWLYDEVFPEMERYFQKKGVEL